MYAGVFMFVNEQLLVSRGGYLLSTLLIDTCRVMMLRKHPRLRSEVIHSCRGETEMEPSSTLVAIYNPTQNTHTHTGGETERV